MTEETPQNSEQASSPEPDLVDGGGAEHWGSDEDLEVLEPEPDQLIGSLVGERYRVLELIGRGGMGAVYRAEHVHMRKAVALKVLHREMTALEDVVQRFEREAVAAGRIDHPNVVQARDFGRLADGALYLVMEFVEGKMLDVALAEAGGLFALERVLSIAGQIAEALEGAHEQGIVHRDLSPENVMLVERPGEPELVKVLDFGIAKVSVHERGGSDRPITKVGSVFGTPEYMSPEQAGGQTVDHRSDLYSLGLIIYRMLVGNPPFMGEEIQAVLMKQITVDPPELSEELPLPVRELVSDLLQKAPEQRPQDATEVVERVLSLLGQGLPNSRSRTRAKLASMSDAPPASLGFTHRLDTSAIGRPLHVAGRAVPLWRIGLVAAMAALAGAALVVALVPEAPKEEVRDVTPTVAPPPVARVEPAPLPSAEPAVERLLGRAFLGDLDALAELQARDPDFRTVREWLALGRGWVKNNRIGDALFAYQVALEKQPSVSEDAVLRRDVHNAMRDSEHAEMALNLAADHLGSLGADMLYRIWVDTKDVTPATRLARDLVYRPDVRKAASPALQFLLDWREAIGCSDYERLLPSAALHADRRALTLLKRTQVASECDLPEDSLEAAILAARDRSQPAPY